MTVHYWCGGKMSSNFTEAELEDLRDKVKMLWTSALTRCKLTISNDKRYEEGV
jgi:hypothetical protein